MSVTFCRSLSFFLPNYRPFLVSVGHFRSWTYQVRQDEIHKFRQKQDFGHNYELFEFDVLHNLLLPQILLSKHRDRLHFLLNQHHVVLGDQYQKLFGDEELILKTICEVTEFSRNSLFGQSDSRKIDFSGTRRFGNSTFREIEFSRNRIFGLANFREIEFSGNTIFGESTFQ